MNLSFAKRMDHLKASEIRELLKLTQQPDIISFAGGLPAAELFPIDAIRKANDKVLAEMGRVALQYGPTEGYVPLREKIVGLMAKQQISATPQDVVVTSGSQQGLDFVARIFINPGDVIITESPSYLGAISAFKAYEPRFVEVAMDEDGMLMEQLEDALKLNPNTKFIYTIPDFQNPTGRTMSVERRQRMVELANEYDVIIVEDNPYGDLRYEGEILPAIKHYDTDGRVIFLGTFSKIFCPGIRLGWAAASQEILNKIVMVKQGADLQTSTIAQMELNQFLEDNNIEEHVALIREVYGHRRDVMLQAMDEYFPEGIEFTRPEGGLFTWVILPENLNAKELGLVAIENKVAFVPGGSFFPNGGNENTLRMNFSCSSDEQIVKGVKAIAQVFREAMEK